MTAKMEKLLAESHLTRDGLQQKSDVNQKARVGNNNTDTGDISDVNSEQPITIDQMLAVNAEVQQSILEEELLNADLRPITSQTGQIGPQHPVTIQVETQV